MEPVKIARLREKHDKDDEEKYQHAKDFEHKGAV
jgi:hypothetical protein